MAGLPAPTASLLHIQPKGQKWAPAAQRRLRTTRFKHPTWGSLETQPSEQAVFAVREFPVQGSPVGWVGASKDLKGCLAEPPADRAPCSEAALVSGNREQLLARYCNCS